MNIDTPEHQQWLTDKTNELINKWLEQTRGLPVTLQLTKLGFAIIDGLEAAYKAGFEAGRQRDVDDISSDNDWEDDGENEALDDYIDAENHFGEGYIDDEV